MCLYIHNPHLGLIIGGPPYLFSSGQHFINPLFNPSWVILGVILWMILGVILGVILEVSEIKSNIFKL